VALLHVFTDGQKGFYVQHCIICPNTIHNHTSYYIKKIIFFKLCLFVVSTNTKWSY